MQNSTWSKAAPWVHLEVGVSVLHRLATLVSTPSKAGLSSKQLANRGTADVVLAQDTVQPGASLRQYPTETLWPKQLLSWWHAGRGGLPKTKMLTSSLSL